MLPISNVCNTHHNFLVALKHLSITELQSINQYLYMFVLFYMYIGNMNKRTMINVYMACDVHF